MLAAVGSPLPPDVRPVTGPFGQFGRPAVEFTPQTYVGRWAKELLPRPFYTDFGMKVTIYLQSIQGGVLFSVLKPDHSKIILGVNILSTGNENQTIEFIYTNPDKGSGETQLTASFVLPKFERQWTVFSLAVQGQKVTLYFKGCERVYSKVFKTKRIPLLIENNSPVFIGMAGWYIQKPVLFVSLFNFNTSIYEIKGT